jgi:hypothetical protein
MPTSVAGCRSRTEFSRGTEVGNAFQLQLES